MSNEGSDKEDGKQESRDAMAPIKTEVIGDDQEDNTIEKSRTASLHINDCNLSGSIKNVSEMKKEVVQEGDHEDDGIVMDPEAGTIDIQEIILNEVKIEENIFITNERTDHTLQLTCSGDETFSRVSTLTTREALICKKLTKSDLANGLYLPGEQVRKKLFTHISPPPLGEGKDVILVDHYGQEWNMLLVHQHDHFYILRGHWYDYSNVYNLVVSDTIIIEKVSKLHVKEELDFDAVNEIGDHDWDTIFPPNSTWQTEQINNVIAEDVDKPDDQLAEQIEIKDIGKVLMAVDMYEITIKRGAENRGHAQKRYRGC